MDGRTVMLLSHISPEGRDNLIAYVKHQEAHHKTRTFREEIMDLYEEHDIEFDENYPD